MMRKTLLITVGYAVIAAVYMAGRASGPGWGDAIGFLVTALSGFSWSVNATGHFLYVTVAASLVRLIPRSDPAMLLQGFSIICALLTLWRIRTAAMALTGSAAASFAAMAAFAFSFTFWRQAEQVEVYPFYLFLVASAVSGMLIDLDRGGHSHARAVSGWLALSLLTHIQTILLFPLYGYYLVVRMQPWSWQETGRTVTPILVATAVLVVPAALLKDLTVGSVFFDMHFREQVFHAAVGDSVSGALKSVVYFLYNFHLFVPVIIAGWVAAWCSARRVMWAATVGSLPLWVFAMRYPVSDNYVFFLVPYLQMAIISAYGFRAMLDLRLFGRFRLVMPVAVLVLSPMVYGIAAGAAPRFPLLAAVDQRLAYKGGIDYYLWPGLRGIPDIVPLVRQADQPGTVPPGIPDDYWRQRHPQVQEYLHLRDSRR